MSNTLSETQVDAYLARMGFNEPPGVNRESLDALVFAHQCTIPFETIDMHLCETPPVIDVDTIFDKIITRKRGGYCFELNFLFELLLVELGFDAEPRLSRAVRGREGRMPINHRGIVVALENVLLFVDVGFGGPLPPGSLVLEDGLTQTVRGEIFTTVRTNESWWAIERVTQASKDLYGDEYPSRVQVELELCTAHVEHIDFVALNLAFSQPGTVFHDVRLANLRTENGFFGLRENTLTIRESGERQTIDLPDDESFSQALLKYFGFR